MSATLLHIFLLLSSCNLIASQTGCRDTLTLSACDCNEVNVDVTSNTGELSSCQNLSELLVAYNGMVSEGDCLELNLEPGVYTLTSHTASVNYSAVITAPRGGVSITCQSQCGTASENVVSGSPLAFHKNGTSQSSFVTLKGITFQDCLLPLQFDDLDNVALRNCTFRNFSASAVDLFNCLSITIDDCHFDSSRSRLKKAQFRGNAGGLSIAYRTRDPSTTDLPQIWITDSTFTNNRAFLPLQSTSQQINRALNDNFFFGRGGGLGIFLNEPFYNITVEISNCNFSGNFAQSVGGGALFLADGNDTHHNFTVTNCNFWNNSAMFGGGLQMGFQVQNLNSTPSSLTLVNSSFVGNVADFGGGLGTVQIFNRGSGNMLSMSGSYFAENRGRDVGSAVMFASLLYIQNRQQSIHYRVRDCSFEENIGPGGTLAAGFIHVNFEGSNTFKSNMGPGLRVVGSLIEVRDRLSFIGNNAENFEGGALYISAFGQVKLYSGSQIDFINNTGRIGSAIVVNVQRSSVVFSKLVYNPQCFLLHETSTLPPNKWNDVKIRFQGNTAQVGPTVYISHLDLCAWFAVNTTGVVNVTFNIEDFTQWPVFDYTNNSNVALAHNSNSSNFYFQTEAIEMTSGNNTDNPVVIRPGQTRPLNLVGRDQLGNPTYIIIRISDSRANINPGAFSQAGDTATYNTTEGDIIRFEPALVPIQPSDEVVNISYGFANRIDQVEFDVTETIPITFDTPYNVRSTEGFNLTLQFANCQPGYEIRQRVEGDLYTCSCVDTDFDVLNCDDDDDVIVLRDGLWAGAEDDPIPHVDVYPCPVPYCSCHRRDSQICETLFFQSDPNQDQQCHANRRGALCGECENGTGVGVLRTNCRECSGEAYYALGILIVADIILPILILLASVKLRYSFPHSLKGLVFYIQTVYYVTEYFPISFWDARQYMLYLGSLLGLYFPWDFCLMPGMDALLSLGLRFLPPLIVSIVAVASLLTVYYWFEKRARKRIWHGIWALVLLMYAPLVHTCTSLIHCPVIPGASNEAEERRWFLNGQVECFSNPAHAGLGAVAVIVLIILILLIPAIFIFTLVGKNPRVQAYSLCERIYEALVEGYEDKVRWWGAWDLLRRLLIITLVVALPGRSVSPLFVIVPCFALHLFLLPYQKLWQNLIETALLINYILLFLLRSTQTFLDNLSSYSGTSVPAEWGAGLAGTDSLTWLFTPFFYLPVLFAVVFCSVQAVYIVARPMYYKKRPRVNTEFAVIDTASGYRDFDDSLPSTGSQNVTFTELNVQTIY